MTAENIKDRISECATLFGFEYGGKDGNIDPYYIHETKSHEYLLFYDGAEQMVYSFVIPPKKTCKNNSLFCVGNWIVQPAQKDFENYPCRVKCCCLLFL